MSGGSTLRCCAAVLLLAVLAAGQTVLMPPIPRGRQAVTIQVAGLQPTTACPNDCNMRGDCTQGQCVCADGWQGPDCGQIAPYCPRNCSGRGQCLGFRCVCGYGSRGVDCSRRVEASPCPQSCMGNGVCLYGRCVCRPPWLGDACDTMKGANMSDPATPKGGTVQLVVDPAWQAYNALRKAQDRMRLGSTEPLQYDYVVPRVPLHPPRSGQASGSVPSGWVCQPPTCFPDLQGQQDYTLPVLDPTPSIPARTMSCTPSADGKSYDCTYSPPDNSSTQYNSSCANATAATSNATTNATQATNSTTSSLLPALPSLGSSNGSAPAASSSVGRLLGMGGSAAKAPLPKAPLTKAPLPKPPPSLAKAPLAKPKPSLAKGPLAKALTAHGVAPLHLASATAAPHALASPSPPRAHPSPPRVHPVPRRHQLK